ncbi:MAG: response regulator [Magnetococcales bacterium]|nr:response regulator [Magnetococcales bacterium]
MGSNILLLDELLCDDYHTFFATSGQSALLMAAEKMPDLILLDILMPDMDGMEVCRRLKANPVTARIPVIFITAVSAPDTETEGLAIGAVDYITKPFNPAIVRQRVRNQLAINPSRDDLEERVHDPTFPHTPD